MIIYGIAFSISFNMIRILSEPNILFCNKKIEIIRVETLNTACSKTRYVKLQNPNSLKV